MIDIKSKSDCCGCGACVQRCPKQCIKMIEDSEGFLYPHVEIQQCINCGLCNRVCPVLSTKTEDEKSQRLCYAAYCQNEIIRNESSSGGIFTLLAETIISQGGIVCGARFNNKWEVNHAIIETKEELSKLRGSKYVQSRIDDIFINVEYLLKQNRLVFFSGTPCQIAGLHKFLRKDYTNLFTVDFICHGVPSPGVWRKYLSDLQSDQTIDTEKKFVLESESFIAHIKNIRFRDKANGWKDFRFVILVSDTSCVEETVVAHKRFENEYMNSFLKNYNLRPSCYKCPVKGGRSGSDITLCDFWGVEKEFKDMNDDKGVSGVIINTNKGEYLFTLIEDKCYHRLVNMDRIIAHNKSYNNSCKEPMYRKYFFRRFSKGKERIEYLLTPNKTDSFCMFMERVINKFIKITR